MTVPLAYPVALAAGTSLERHLPAPLLAEGPQGLHWWQWLAIPVFAAEVEFAVEVEEFASPTALGSNQPRRGRAPPRAPRTRPRAADALERGGHRAGLVRR